MKFLLEIVSCCGSNSSRKITSTNPPSVVEEKRSLVAPSPPLTRRSSHRYRSRKRGRVTSDWRPSLSAISEEKDDRTSAVRDKKPAEEEGHADGLSPHQKLQRRFRREPPSTVIPTFSPTSFLF